MADLRIADAPELDESEVQGGLKLPTGGFGNKAINMTTVANWVVKDKDLPSKGYVDTAVAQGNQGLAGHVANKNNPHQVTKEQVGLGNVDNTADVDKPVSNAASAALNLKADKSQLQGLATTTQLDGKADKSTTYTKTEVDGVVDDLYQSLEDNFVANGVALPYDPQVTYNDGAVVNDNGTLKVVENGNLELAVKADGVQVGDSTLEVFSQNVDKNLKIITPYFFGAKGNRIDDDTQAIKDFFEFCSKNLVITADWTGDFLIKGDIFADTGSTQNWKDKPTYCQNFVGHMTLRSDYASDGFMLDLQNFNDTYFNGKLTIIGKGSSNLNTRQNRHLLRLHNCKKFNFSHLELWYARAKSLVISGTSTAYVIGVLDQWYCGIGAGASSAPSPQLLSNPQYVHKGTTGNTNQRTEVTVDVGTIPLELDIDDFILFFDTNQKLARVKLIKAIDRENNKLYVFPWVCDDELAITPNYIWGGAYATGGDTSAGKICKQSTTACGIGFNSQSLYPVSIDKQISQFNGIAFASGNSASEGGVMLSMYCEANAVNDLACGGNSKYSILSAGPVEDWKFKNIQAAILEGDVRKQGVSPSPRNIAKTGKLNLGGGYQPKESATFAYPVISNDNPTPVTFFSHKTNGGTTRGNTIKLNFNKYINEQFGLDTIYCFVTGLNADGSATGNVKFQSDESGILVNGVTTAEFQLTKPTLFICRFIVDQWLIVPFSQTKNIDVALNYDPESIPANSSVTTTVELQGVSVGQPVIAAFSQYNTGVKVEAVVSSANTVTVEFINKTATAIDLASGTLTVKAI